jgi:high affinity sulfate transporter 1
VLEQARTYERRWLVNDVTAGLVLVALLVPAGMAYAQASGLPPISGLYATVVPLLVYAVVGPSRVLVMGPDSALAPLIAAVVLPLAGRDPGRAVALAGLLALLVGLIAVLAGLARFGFLAELLSAPVRYGYLNGIALTIVVSQLPHALGFSVHAETMLGTLRGVWDGIDDGRTDGRAIAIAVVALVVIVVLRRLTPVIPGVLIVVVGAIAATVLFGFKGDGLALVGDLPSGFPTPRLPELSWSMIGRVGGAAFGIAFVAFADTSVLARVYALKRGARVDSNQELVALGMVNVVTGLFQGFPVSGSQSRTPVAEAAGARTQLTGVVAAVALLVLLMAAPGAFRDLPEACLAAVVIAAAMRIVAITPVARLARVRRSEFLLSLAAFAMVAVLGAIVGVAAAVALSLFDFMRKAWKPHTTALVRVDGLKGYHDAERHPEGHHVPGLLLYRFDAPLFFANSRFFVEDLMQRIDSAPEPVRTVVVTAEPITDIDVTAADALKGLLADLEARGVELRFSELKGHVRERLLRYGFDGIDPQAHFARTTGEAVKSYVRDTGTEWVDWEDRPL